MNYRLIATLYVAALVLILGQRVHSQSAFASRSVQQLSALKAANQELLDKQNATLVKLDELLKDAGQVKFMTKRG